MLEQKENKESPCAAAVENLAAHIVWLLQSFVDIMRKHDRQKFEAQPQLHEQMKDSGLVQQVLEATRRVREVFPHQEVYVDADQDALQKQQGEVVVVLHQVVWPLLRALEKLYSFLDSVVVVSPTTNPTTKRPPPPPPGLLSLHQYTDIAVMCEWTVCTSMHSSMKSRTIPRSLSGRFPPSSHQWAQQQHTAATDTAVLCVSTRLLSNLLLLDRFRPLLHRHVSDLLVNVWLQDDDDLKSLEEQILNVIDNVVLARACQSLLSSPNLLPLRVKQRVSAQLSFLALHDLNTVIQVFVLSTSAPLLLAKVLAVTTISKDWQALTHSMMRAMDEIKVQSMEQWLASNRDGISRPLLQTNWALMMDYIPLHVLQSEMLGWNGSSETISSVVLRWGLLLSEVPPFAVNSQRLLQLVLTTSPDRPNVLTLLVRLVAIKSVTVVPLQENAMWTLRLLIQTLLRIVTLPEKIVDLVASAMVHAVGPGDWDQRHRFGVDAGDARIEEHDNNSDLSSISEFVEQQTTALVTNIVNWIGDSDDPNNKELTGTFFRTLLEMYLSTDTSAPFHNPFYSVVPMVALPIVCEKCSQERLLTTNGATGMLQLMGIVFRQASIWTMPRPHEANDVEWSLQPWMDNVGSARIATHTFLADMLGTAKAAGPSDPTFLSSVDDGDILIPICIILLSVLIGILELGVDQRSEAEEAKLQQLTHVLRPLAGTLYDELGLPEAERVPAEVTQMASHALALIVARQTGPRLVGDDEDGPHDALSGAEQDLASSEVPMRARAVVTLRHLAASTTNDHDLWQIARLVIRALKDTESYVFLGAIQTVVSLVDDRPRTLLPLVGIAVASGILRCPDHTEEQLSQEQRIKLAEALMGSIRRRASVNEYLSTLLDLLLFADPSSRDKNDDDEASSTARRFIQIQTHNYFINDNRQDEEVLTQHQRWDELDIRVKTGGPIFDLEEQSLIWAALMGVLYDVLQSAHPSVLASGRNDTCLAIMACALSALRHSDRPVRRAGALLAKGLYEALVREQDEMLLLQSSEISFAVAMVRAGEERLALALEPSDLLSERYYDEAVVARCQEALELRSESEGILVAARLLDENEQRVHPLTTMLREATRNKGTASKMIEEL